jgi:hypothetical protein
MLCYVMAARQVTLKEYLLQSRGKEALFLLASVDFSLVRGQANRCDAEVVRVRVRVRVSLAEHSLYFRIPAAVQGA